MKPPKHPKQYGWRYAHDTHCYGPHNSVEACIDEAGDDPENRGPGTEEIWVSEIEWADPVRYLDSSIVWRAAEERAFDDFGFVDDDIFVIPTALGAEAEEALDTWARKYLEPRYWRMGEKHAVHMVEVKP